MACVSMYYVLVLFHFYLGILSSYFPISYVEMRCYFIHQTQHFYIFSRWFPTANQISVQLILEAFLWLGIQAYKRNRHSHHWSLNSFGGCFWLAPCPSLSSRLSLKSIVSIISIPMEVMPFNSMEQTHFYSRYATGWYPDPPKENTIQNKHN